MAILRVHKGYEFVGLSSDSKPTDNVPLFSTFMCSDNGKIYLYHYASSDDGTKEWKVILN